MKTWEIKERENKYSRHSDEQDESMEYSEDYDCGYEDGYIAALKEYRSILRRNKHD